MKEAALAVDGRALHIWTPARNGKGGAPAAPMIKYIGSKRLLIARILQAVGAAAPAGGTVLDLFSGTARVGPR